MRRVHWMELFFDLVFVVFIGQLAQGLGGEPGWQQFATFLFLFAIGWWAWINVTVTVNILPNLPVRRLAIVMLLGMLAVGAMAVAAPDAIGNRGWLFALGCAGLRLVLLPLWFFRAKRDHQSVRPPLLYNGVTAALWVGSAFVPQPEQLVVWVAATALEVGLTIFALQSDAPLADELEVPHLTERLGLFVIIVMGESVLSVIEALSANWEPAGGLVAFLGLTLIAALAWTYFLHNARFLEEGLDALLKARNTVAMRDVAMFMPFVLVAGVTAVAAGLATAVEYPAAPLSLGSLVALFGGLAAFYLTGGFVGIRMRRATRAMIPWLLLGVGLPVLGLALSWGLGLSSTAAVAVAAAAVAGMTLFGELQGRRAQLVAAEA
jgi:low temperature requirement protein LtrA